MKQTFHVLGIALALVACTSIEQLPPDAEASLRRTAVEFLAETRRDFWQWRDARIADVAYPLYRPDLKEVAYYEFPVVAGRKGVPAGFILLSTGPHDNRVVQWGTRGTSNVQQLKEQEAKLKKKGYRYYLIDAFSFVAEDREQTPIAQLGDYELLNKKKWRRFKRTFAKSHEAQIKAQRDEATEDWRQPRLFGTWCDSWKYYWAGNDADQRYYDQLDSGESPNTSDCQSGCGATAWAMLFGWADYRASQNDPVWSASYGMYGDASVVAPPTRDTGVSAMIWEIRNDIETECSGDQGRTWPWNMDQARQYLSSRPNSSPSLTTHYNQLAFPTDGLRDRADAAIRAGRPVIIALGWEHYALAWGYRKKQCRLGRDKHDFHINNGHGWSRWTSAGTWFVGEIKPYVTSTPPPECPDGEKCCWHGLSGNCLCVPNDAQCPDLGPVSGCPGEVCCEPGEDSCKICAHSHLECPIPK
jgi:hypothetical protein